MRRLKAAFALIVLLLATGSAIAQAQGQGPAPNAGPKVSDEELIMRYYAGPEFVDALKSAPPRKEYLDARKPRVKLVEELGKKKDLGHFYFKKGDITLSIRRRGEAVAE